MNVIKLRISEYVSQQMTGLYATSTKLGIGLLLSLNVYGQGPPNFPVNHWGLVDRDGLRIVDGASVAAMMDCDNDPTTPPNGYFKGREMDVRKGAFPTTIGGYLSVDTYEQTENTCGYSNDPDDAHLRVIDLLIGGEMAFPRDLPVGQGTSAEPGDAIQQRFDTYMRFLRVEKVNPSACGPANCDIEVWWCADPGDPASCEGKPGNPEATAYDTVRGSARDLRSGGLGAVSVDQVACNRAGTSISGGILTDNLEPCEGGLPSGDVCDAFFYANRPQNSIQQGNYSRDSAGNPRENPQSGDCP